MFLGSPLPRRLGLQAPALFLHLADTNAVGFSEERRQDSSFPVDSELQCSYEVTPLPNAFLNLVQAHHNRPSTGDQKGSWGLIGHLLITLIGS